MLTLYFFWGEDAPVMRVWPVAPRVGDLLMLPEFGEGQTFDVFKIVWEGYEDPRIKIYLRESRVAHRHEMNGVGLRSFSNGQ